VPSTLIFGGDDVTNPPIRERRTEVPISFILPDDNIPDDMDKALEEGEEEVTIGKDPIPDDVTKWTT
jgi:hypothetical protein